MSLISWQPSFVPAGKNVFSGLFPSLEVARAKTLATKQAYMDNIQEVTKIMEETLLVTLNSSNRDSKHYLVQLAKSRPGQSWLDVDLLDSCVEEMLGVEGRPVHYLVACLKRCRDREVKLEDSLYQQQMDALKHCLLRKTGNILTSKPSASHDLYSDYDNSVSDEITKLLKEETEDGIVDILEASLEEVHTSARFRQENCLQQVFSQLAEEVRRIPLSQVASSYNTLQLVVSLCCRPRLAAALLCASSGDLEGKSWEQGVLGRMMAISVVGPKPEYFTENASTMLISDYRGAETNANSNTNFLFPYLLRAWEGLLRAGPETRYEALSWLGSFIKANQGRRGSAADMNKYCSTAMCVNLARLLVTMSLKLLKSLDTNRLMQVSAEYFTVAEEVILPKEEEDFNCCEKGGTGIHMFGFLGEEMLVPETEITCHTETEHGLISEIFFMAHCVLDMGVNQGFRELKTLKTNLRKLAETEKELEEGREAMFTKVQMTPEGPVQVHMLVREKSQLKRIKDNMYMLHACLSTALLNTELQDQLKIFIKLSTLWLIRKCGVESSHFDTDLLSHLQEEAPQELSSIPEFMFENLHHFLLLHDLPPIDRREQRQDILVMDLQADILHLLTVLMLTRWVRNPHLRAKFAKALELLLPKSNSREEVYRAAALLQPEFQGSLLQPLAVQVSEGLFRNLPCKRELCTAVYNVFVSMEVAGESLQFDEKFNYRYPLNAVLFYLLKIDDFREEMLVISESTHQAMTESQQPIFLKFINILVNDGIRLLDESLTHLKKIHQCELEMDAPAWVNLPDETRKQKLGDLKKCTEMSTRFNLLSSDNIRMIEALTRLSCDVFTHPDMVDRMACMLNYFLEKVTGRERREYRVRQKETVMFKPRSLLQSLARIYSHLAASNDFIMAIAKDGRSYHPGLFLQAADTLHKLGVVELGHELTALASRVREAALQEELVTTLTLEAPEEFLDPIMSTLMAEPVLLPSSGKVVDRTTIAKHLLTDQSDPFNRQALTLASVVPQEELKRKIRKWIDTQQRIEPEKTKRSKSGGLSENPMDEENDTTRTMNNPDVGEVEASQNMNTNATATKNLVTTAAPPAKAYGVKVLPRIMRDLKQLSKEAPEDMKIAPDENDFTRIHVIITGPEDTPYDGGFFYFTLDCPPNYPEAPPKALIHTTDGGRVRFNPNLYREGKVCLSILGTWSGPGWTSALSLHSVLISIQSLMNETPIRNEPGYDNMDTQDPKCRAYNEIISHEVVRVAYLGMIKSPPKDMPQDLHSWMLERAVKHRPAMLKVVKKNKHLDSQRFDFYENKGVFKWKDMEKELCDME